MKEKVDVAIIGGGVNGNTIAYNLAKEGYNVSLYEKDFLASGATGRSGAGIRQQFATRENIKLAKRSVEIFEKLETELDQEFDLEQGGYLIPVHSEGEKEEFMERIQLQQKMDVESEWITPSRINKIVPELDLENIGCIGASWCPTDGHLDPFKLTHAYAEKTKALGGEINTYTKVKDVLVEHEKIKGVKTQDKKIAAESVVIAAGAWTRLLTEKVGIEIPTFPERHEIYITEKLSDFLDPMIIDFKSNIYFSQAKTGGILGGWGGYAPKALDYNTDTSLKFLKNYSSLLKEFIPKLANVNVLRQWAGFYDVTPDAKPIVGKTRIENLFLACGFSGHGLMISPAVGELTTDLITKGKTTMPKVMKELSLDRFKKGKIEKEKGVVG